MTKIILAFLLAACAVAPALADGVCSYPPQPLRAIAKTHIVPPYPALSISMEEQGTSLLAVLIGPDGKVVSDKVISSSGSARLDEAALDYVKANWLWDPTSLGDCKQVSTKVSIKWDLRDAPDASDPNNPTSPIIVATKADYPPDALARREQGWTQVAFMLAATGETSHFQTVLNSGFPDLDTKAADVVRAHHWIPATMDGRPVTTEMVVAVEWTLDGTPPPAPQAAK